MFNIFSALVKFMFSTTIEIVRRQLNLPTNQEPNLMIFELAAENGELKVIEKYIKRFGLEKAQAMLSASNFGAFVLAARNGHIHVLEKFISLFPEQIQDMLSASNFGAFVLAAKNGHIHVLEKFISLCTPEQVQAMLSANNFGAFQEAVRNGHIHVLEKFISLCTPEQVQDMLRANNFGAFVLAAQNGHIHVLEKFISLCTTEQVQDMLRADNFGAFRRAAQNGHIHVLEKFISLYTPEQVQDMLRADNFGAFRRAAQNGHIHVLEKFISHFPEQVQDMLSANNFGAFVLAAQNGHIHVLEKFISLCTPEQVQDMLHADDFGALRGAYSYNKAEVIEKLMAFPDLFILHERWRYLKPHVRAFVNKRLRNLSQEIDASPLDVNHEQAKLYFYMARYLIQEARSESLDGLNQLLSIPSVKALAHDGAHELLRLAMTQKNVKAAIILLEISDIQKLADEHNFHLGDYLDNWSKEELVTFIQDLPAAVSSTKIHGKIYSPPACYLLNLPQSKLETLYDIYTSDDERVIIKPYQMIDENRLFELIRQFEKNPTPQSDIACALLLGGYIENEVLREGLGPDYAINRRLFALDFLRRAAANADENLQKIIESVVLHLKIQEPEDSPIYKKLSAFYFSVAEIFKEGHSGEIEPYIAEQEKLPPIDLASLEQLLTSNLNSHGLFKSPDNSSLTSPSP